MKKVTRNILKSPFVIFIRMPIIFILLSLLTITTFLEIVYDWADEHLPAFDD